jgi:phosphatidylinositol-4,5-bisphosphate 4-phosphatase
MLSNDPSKAARQAARRLFKQAMVQHLNSQPWNTIEETFQHGANWYSSRMTPAAQMKLGTRCIFPNDYDDKGICSGSSSCTDHAVNLWISEFTSSARPLAISIGDEAPPQKQFSGVRFGILSPYGLDDVAARRTGAIHRAREVVAAALYMKLSPDGLQQALESGDTVDLKLTSSSLVTAMNWGKNTEGSQIADQMHAWHQLADNGPIACTLHDQHGQPRTVNVNLNVAAFNFGVNEFALDFGAGTRTSDRYNREAMRNLCGSEDLRDREPGGWVGEYLAGNPSNADRVRHLYGQIRDIWRAQAHRTDGGEPYKLPSRIALLSHEIGVVPCYNCKSGKDRTAWLDQEIKFGAAELQARSRLPAPGSRLSEEQRRFFGLISTNSGNFRIQQQNTGAGGNKVLKRRSAQVPTKLSLSQRLPDRQAVKTARGLSGLVSA